MFSDNDNPVLSSGRRARKRQQTADHLADCAWQLFTRLGYEQVSMERIAEQADVAKATLYKHFPVKAALLSYRFHRELAEHWPAIEQQLSVLPSAEAQLRVFFQHSAAWSEAHKPYLRAYLELRLSELSHTPAQQRSGFEGIFTQLLRCGQQRGDVIPQCDPLQLAHYLQFLHLACVMRWLGASTSLSLAAEIDAMVTLFFNGIRSRP